jgi:hypothetical protein
MPEPSDAAEFRRMAEHYLACARQMSNPGDKVALLEMAEYWTNLADHYENEDKGKKSRK